MKVIILLSLFVMVSCQKHVPAPVSDSSHKKNRSTHLQARRNKYQQQYTTVKNGDTLYSIGFKHNLDYKTLAAINNIPQPYRIYPGQKLRLVRDKSQKQVVKTHAIKPKGNLKAKTTGNNEKPTISTVITKKPLTVKPKPTPKLTPKPKPTAQPKVKINKKPIVNQVAPSSNSRWIWPLNGRIISTFSNQDTSRKGIDIASKPGTAVFASNNGTVVYSGDGLRGYGELIIIKHSNNLLSAYAHNSNRLVKEGQTVKQGQKIATSGKGIDGKELLHFEIRKNGQPVNPLKYLPKR